MTTDTPTPAALREEAKRLASYFVDIVGAPGVYKPSTGVMAEEALWDCIDKLAALAEQAPPAPVAITMRPMQSEDGRKGWYIDTLDFYCDLEQNENGAWEVFFRDKATGREAFGERVSAAPVAVEAVQQPAALHAKTIFRIKAQSDRDGLDVVGFAWRLQKEWLALSAPAAPTACPCAPAGDGTDDVCPDPKTGRLLCEDPPTTVAPAEPAAKALEFAEYMAKGAEQLLEAINAEDVAREALGDEEHWKNEHAAEDVDVAVASRCEFSTGLRANIYEFRKRAARAGKGEA